MAAALEQYKPSKLPCIVASIGDLVSAGTMGYITYRDATLMKKPQNAVMAAAVYAGNVGNIASQYMNMSNVGHYQRQVDKIKGGDGPQFTRPSGFGN